MCTVDIAQKEKYQHRHDNFKPIKNLSQYENALVYNAHDSVLTARKARYDLLVKDYNSSFDDMFIKSRGLFIVCKNFNNACVFPKYAKQVGVKNIRQFSKYISTYERDSLAPVYRNVYQSKIIPVIRNNTCTK